MEAVKKLIQSNEIEILVLSAFLSDMYDRLRYDKPPSELTSNILRIMDNRAKIRDGLPRKPTPSRAVSTHTMEER